jgi:HEAT repeat protein
VGAYGLPSGVPEYETPEQFISDLKSREDWSLANVWAARGTDVGEAAVPSLVELLHAQHQETKMRAAWALGEMACQTERVVPALLDAFADPDPRFHYCVVSALKDIGPKAAEAVPALLAALDDPAEPHPAAVAAALWSVNREPRAVDALIELLDHEDPDTRCAAADYLCAIGPESTRRAVPALLEARHDEDPNVRCVALSALVKLVPPERASALLAEAWKDEDEYVRNLAAGLLKKSNVEAIGTLSSEQDD